jgi:deoxyribonucleoside regulator
MCKHDRMVDGIAHERTQDALRAAHLYYMQDLTMEAIASELGTSRSSVSRLLSFARETGLVDIQIRSPLDLATVLGEQLHERYGVVAHVVPVPDQTSDVDRVDRVALSAARMLTQYVDSNMVVGVAWGSTVSAVSRYLVPKPTHNTLVVQLNGAGNVRTTGIMYASEILRRFGQAYGATVQQFPVPAFFDDPATKLALWRERSTKRVLELQERMDMVLFGVGSPVALVPSHVYSGGYLERSDQRALDAEQHRLHRLLPRGRLVGRHRHQRAGERTGPGDDPQGAATRVRGRGGVQGAQRAGRAGRRARDGHRARRGDGARAARVT